MSTKNLTIHLTEEAVFERASDHFDHANLNVDKYHELAEAMGLEFDESADAYLNPDLIPPTNCPKCFRELDKDIEGNPFCNNDEIIFLSGEWFPY